MDLCDTLSAFTLHVSWLWPIVKVLGILAFVTIISFIATALLMALCDAIFDTLPCEGFIFWMWMLLLASFHLITATLMGWITWI